MEQNTLILQIFMVSIWILNEDFTRNINKMALWKTLLGDNHIEILCDICDEDVTQTLEVKCDSFSKNKI